MTSTSPHQQPLACLLPKVATAIEAVKNAHAPLAKALSSIASGRPAYERAALQAILYDWARRRVFCECVLNELVARRPPQACANILEASISLLVSGAYPAFTIVNEAVKAVRFSGKTSRYDGLTNAVLRRASRELNSLTAKLETNPTVKFNTPLWWFRKVRESQPERALDILLLQQKRPPMTLRVNQRRCSTDDYIKQLDSQDIQARKIAPNAVVLSHPIPVVEIPGFCEGIVSIQDAGAQLAAHLLPIRSGMRVLDACAAPGGKTCHLLEMHSNIDLTAFDIDATRCRMIRENLDRLKLSAKVLAVNASNPKDWPQAARFGAILLDAPCTASGTVRRNPDVPWSRRPSDISSLCLEQRRILEVSWGHLEPNGHLLYCTCSIFPEEGPAQMDAFVRRHPDAELVPFPGAPGGMLTLLPRDCDPVPSEDAFGLCGPHDGFFYALLRKTPD